MAHNFRHPAHADLWTPVTPELLALFQRMHDELGTWREVCQVSGTRPKVLRNLRTPGVRKAISMTVVDRLITATGVGDLEEFTWFTADDLVALGIWDEVLYVEGVKRIKGDNVYIGEHRTKRRKKPRKVSSRTERRRRRGK